MYKILFVCTGNICRSPTTEGVMQHYLLQQKLTDRVILDSAGTHSYHIGEAPDPRSIAAAQKRGIDISSLRARKIKPSDFHDFDLILACDSTHLDVLLKEKPTESKAHVALYLPYVGISQPKDIPDPYYGSHRDFEYVLDLAEQASRELLKKIV